LALSRRGLRMSWLIVGMDFLVIVCLVKQI
jgi:hypothetical protein